MVSGIPNRTKIEGRVTAVSRSTEHPDFVVLHIRASKLSRTKGMASLVTQTAKEQITVLASVDVQKEHGLKEGTNLKALVRSAPGKIFIIPDSVEVKPE